MIVGHSLGAAIASLLAIVLKPKYPKLHCFAYSPPGCVIKYAVILVFLISNLYSAIPILYSILTAWRPYHTQDHS